MDEPIAANQTKAQREILTEMRKNFDLAKEADDHNRRDALDDMKFSNIAGYQWDENMKKERGNRPCWEFNKIRISNKRVINNMRANRPDGKVRPVEGGDQDRAEILAGLIRNILAKSDSDTIMDYAGGYQCAGGMGAWRVVTEYSDDDTFEQDIRIKGIPNPFTLFSDPSAQDQMRRDARWWILTERVSRDEYNERWPDAEPVSFEDHEFDDDDEWGTSDEEIRIAEYWYKEQAEKEILQLETGQVIESTSEEAVAIQEQMPEMIVNRRKVTYHKIMTCTCSGNAVLDGPTEWAGKIFPFVVVYGDFQIIDGKAYWYGLTRFARDAQKSYNVSRSALGEAIAQTPKSFFWATTKQAEGNVRAWKTAHQKALPFLVYTPDPQAPGAPQRMGGADVPVALIQETQMAAEEVNMTTGIYQHDVGAPNAATSGRQEIARQQAGSLASFHIEDNMAKGVQLTWEILLDLVPKVYDTERELRVLGADGAEDYPRVNAVVPGTYPPQKINDITVGKYDVTITLGPNFTTRRQEAVETYQPILQSNPELMPVIGDLVFKSMDLPYAEEISERLQAMAPPQIQAIMNKDAQIPPEVQAAMQQVEQAVQMIQQREEAVTQAASEAEMEQSQVQKLISDLKADRAQFDAHIAKEIAKLEKLKASITVDHARLEAKQATEGSAQDMLAQASALDGQYSDLVNQTLQGVAQLADAYGEQLDKVTNEIREENRKKPKIKAIESRRENGKLIAVPVYEDAEE